MSELVLYTLSKDLGTADAYSYLPKGSLVFAYEDGWTEIDKAKFDT